MTDTLKFLRIKTIFVHVFLEVSQVALEIKNPPAKVGDVRDLGSTRGSRQSPEAGGGNSLQYSCRKIRWTEKPGRLLSMGFQRVRCNWAHILSLWEIFLVLIQGGMIPYEPTKKLFFKKILLDGSSLWSKPHLRSFLPFLKYQNISGRTG